MNETEITMAVSEPQEVKTAEIVSESNEVETAVSEPNEVETAVYEPKEVETAVSEPKEVDEVPEQKVVEETENKAVYAVVSGTFGLNLREQPTINSTSLGVLTAGTQFLIEDPTKINDEWVSVVTKAGAAGYVMSEYVTLM